MSRDISLRCPATSQVRPQQCVRPPDRHRVIGSRRVACVSRSPKTPDDLQILRHPVSDSRAVCTGSSPSGGTPHATGADPWDPAQGPFGQAEEVLDHPLERRWAGALQGVRHEPTATVPCSSLRTTSSSGSTAPAANRSRGAHGATRCRCRCGVEGGSPTSGNEWQPRTRVSAMEALARFSALAVSPTVPHLRPMPCGSI
jgi:hypothetical protein